MAISYFPAVSGGGGGTWGSITGTLSNQTDLQNALDAKQATLVSGTNIKTINATSLLGSGDITISGSVADGDKGDITVSGSGATWTIDNDAVTTAKILNSNVTLAKIEDISTAHFLGRHTGGSGAVQQVSASQARTILNVEDGADVTDSVNVGSSIAGATAKTTPVDADSFGLIDSADSSLLKETTMSQLKTYMNAISKSANATYTANAIAVLTAVEYAALGSKDSNTIYFVV